MAHEFDVQEVTVRLPPGIKPRSVTTSGFWLFLDWPGQRGDASSLIARKLSGDTILGPELDAGSGLLEYRRPEDKDAGFLYVSPDEGFVDGLGYRQYVACSPRATGQSSRRCTSFGNVREGVFYRYEFSDLLLPAWPQLGQAVYDLVAESMTPR